MSATTGPGGTFTIDNVPPGMYTLTVIREGYAPLTTPITVRTGAATPWSCASLPRSSRSACASPG